MNAVIKEAMKFVYCCLICDLSVTKTISTQPCTVLYFATAVPSFPTPGISDSSGLHFCTYFIAHKACLNIDRYLLVRKSTQICLLSNACHQATGILFCFLYNRTFSRLLMFPDLWRSGSCFLFPRCTFSCCLFSINFQMSLLIHFISSTFYPFLNFCIILFYDTFLLLLHAIQMNSRNLLQLHQI